MKKIISKSAEETQQIAADLAKNLSQGVFALSGDLGAGKTTFVQGFAKALGVEDKIISPTFVLIRQHKIPKKHYSTLIFID
jgi:tRNA threonylcarbamoyladenosine biosynthesis protein TsaE